jgi:hypothetical protein
MPDGTPLKKLPLDLKSLARSYTETSVRQLAGIAENSESDGAKVSAIALLLERGWGKAPQAHTGPDGEGDIRVTIRQIIETVGKSETKPE